MEQAPSMADQETSIKNGATFRVNATCPSSLRGLCLFFQSRGKFTSSYSTSLLTLAIYVTQVPVSSPPPCVLEKSSSPVRSSPFTGEVSWKVLVPDSPSRFRECKFERKYATAKKHVHAARRQMKGNRVKRSAQEM